MHRVSSYVVVATLLSACAGVPSDYKFDPKKSDGLVLGSITYESSIGQYALILVPQTSSNALVASVGYSMWPPLGPLRDEKLDAKGGTFTLAAPAGEYRIVGWQIKQGYKITRNSVPISIPFTVAQGKSSYLGNLHFDEHWENVQLRDKADRDLPVIQSRLEVLKTTPIEFSIAKGFAWEKFGGEYSSRYQMPIIIPIVR